MEKVLTHYCHYLTVFCEVLHILLVVAETSTVSERLCLTLDVQVEIVTVPEAVKELSQITTTPTAHRHTN